MSSSRLFGLIGYPLSHSFSKDYFSTKFNNEKLADAEYELFPIESISQLPSLLDKHPALQGLNVTIPYKETVIPFLDQLDPLAQAVGAINCIKIIRSGNEKPRLIGYNTDVFGFRQSIKPFLESRHERALVLGTGGASKAVVSVLNDIGIDTYLVSRTRSQLNEKKGFVYEELNNHVMNAFKLIVNTTPLGMYPDTNEKPDLPYDFIGSDHLVYDLIYNPPDTALLQTAAQHGATTLNGLSMLKQQAEEAWRIWNS